ncbi:MAG: hypothetical protein FWG10_05590 [Eubacteriaceae bacterium]|nr:hypothetical protein [Eubacteriaceae bacterium]
MPGYFLNSEFDGREILVKKLEMLPFECVVRGYMFGSLWEARKKNEAFCGQMIEGCYKLAQKLAEPLFTPSTKAHVGHDKYISFQEMAGEVGEELAQHIESKMPAWSFMKPVANMRTEDLSLFVAQQSHPISK